MDPRDTEHVRNFEQALANWTDARFVSAEDISTMTMFIKYLVNLAEHDGWTYRGHSWKESSYMGCLVVKAEVEEVPSVVFTNGKTLTGCMRIFLRKLEGDMLEWVPDKFA